MGPALHILLYRPPPVLTSPTPVCLHQPSANCYRPLPTCPCHTFTAISLLPTTTCVYLPTLYPPRLSACTLRTLPPSLPYPSPLPAYLLYLPLPHPHSRTRSYLLPIYFYIPILPTLFRTYLPPTFLYLHYLLFRIIRACKRQLVRMSTMHNAKMYDKNTFDNSSAAEGGEKFSKNQ